VPVLVSPSRKSFLRALTGRDVTRSGPATLAAEIFAAWQGPTTSAPTTWQPPATRLLFLQPSLTRPQSLALLRDSRASVTIPLKPYQHERED
jgi:hypothetical protein